VLVVGWIKNIGIKPATKTQEKLSMKRARIKPSHFSVAFFLAGSETGAGREMSQARAFWARRASGEEKRFDSAHALRTLSSEKMGSPLPIAAAFLSLRFLVGRLLLQLVSELMLGFADLA
jgi:hypothetical protein